MCIRDSLIRSYVARRLKVPQAFVRPCSSISDSSTYPMATHSYTLTIPETDYLDDLVDDYACTICGDVPVDGEHLLDRDCDEDLSKTCCRCCPEYMCYACRVKVGPSCWACLACIQPNEESIVAQVKRLVAMKMLWNHMDDLAGRS